MVCLHVASHVLVLHAETSAPYNIQQDNLNVQFFHVGATISVAVVKQIGIQSINNFNRFLNDGFNLLVICSFISVMGLAC